MFDIVFRNVEVMDGTGTPSFISDVAIKDGKIVKIGYVDEVGPIEIEGEGLTLAPGFIDPHTHSDSQIFFEPSRQCKLRQGVTTELGGQCGWSRGPAAETIPENARAYFEVAINKGIPITLYPTYSKMIEAFSSMKVGAHQGVFVGHHMLRGSVVGMDDREPTPEELQKMKGLLEGAMQEGALGLSTGLVYAPGCYSKTEEIIELAKVVAKYGGIYTSHLRDEGDRLVEAVDEAIRIAKESGVTTNIAHMKVFYKHNKHLIEVAVQNIEEANADGCNIFFDVYPYDACSATMLSTLPPSYLTRDMDWLKKELSNPDGLAKLEKAIMEPTEVWENPLKNAGFDHDLIAVADETPDAVGKTIHEYAVEKNVSDIEAYAEILTKNNGFVCDIRFLMSNDTLAYLYKNPLCTLGTDGLYYGDKTLSHPRGFASFPRFLGRLIREEKILPFEEGVRRITGLTADHYCLKNKGYIREGYDADLVLFDKEHIIDHATYENPFLPNEGIKMVFVSGQAAVVDNQLTGVFNGKMIVREVNS